MFPILHVTGDPHARGVQYGTQAADQIRHSIASYARLFAYRHGRDWTAVQTVALAYVPLLEAHTPDLLTEIRGIAEGSGRTLSEIVALNARTELLAGPRRAGAHPDYRGAMARNQVIGVPQHADTPDLTPGDMTMFDMPPSDQGECTTVAALPEATANGTTLLAQTWDWTGDQRAACVLLRITAPDHPTILTLTEAGIIAKIGLNDAGVGVCLSILNSNADGTTPGLPIHVLLRYLLHLPDSNAVRAAVARVPFAASSCISVADAGGQAVSLEVTPDGAGELEPQEGLLAHTNHCLAEMTCAGERALDPASSSVPRFDRASELLTRQRGALDPAALMDLLRDREGAPNCICRRPDMQLHPSERPESVAGIVLDLPGRVMHVAPGVPCDVEFTAVEVG
jgi:isopenicillin-N N-acyltransferase-like protein